MKQAMKIFMAKIMDSMKSWFKTISFQKITAVIYLHSKSILNSKKVLRAKSLDMKIKKIKALKISFKILKMHIKFKTISFF